MKPQLEEIKETFEFAKLSADSFGAEVTINPEMIDSVLSLVSQVEAMQQALEHLAMRICQWDADGVHPDVYELLDFVRGTLQQVKGDT